MNKLNRFVFSLALGLTTAAFAGAADAGHDHAHMDGMHHAMGTAVSASTADPAWLAAAIAAYPLNTCVVSGDELGGDMGKPVDYVYKVDGQPDRLIRFCCKDCIKDFRKDPDKYLAKLDEAAAEKNAAGAKPAESPHDRSGHDHH